MKRHRAWVLVLALVGLGVFLRLLFIMEHADIDIAFDQKFYYRQATALANEGYLSEEYVVRPPLYTGFVAAVMKVFGSGVNAVRLTQAILSAFTLWVGYLLAKELLGPKAGLVCLAVFAIHPVSIVGSWLILTEFLFTPLLLAAIWFTLRAIKDLGRTRRLLPVGILWGLTALTRGAAAGFFLLVLISLLLKRGRVRLSLTAALVAGLSFLAVLSPWTVRNYTRYGGFMLIDNTAAFNLWLTNTPGISIREFSHDRWQRIENQIERQNTGIREGLKLIHSDPARYAERCRQRFSQFWSSGSLYPTIDVNRYSGDHRVSLFRRVLAKCGPIIHWVILIPALAGIGLSLKHRSYLVLSGFVGYLTLVHALLVANPRHRSPLIPLLIILGIFGVLETIAWARRTYAARE